MDELSAVFDDVMSTTRGKRGSKRKSFPPPVLSVVTAKKRIGRPSKQSINSSDEGIDMSSGMSSDPFNESIAQSVKRHKRQTNSKQFDSKYFYDSVVDRIEYKYKNNGKQDAIIDLQNLEIIGKKGFVEQRVRTDFGYFAENTLEDLRQNSFRDKDLISCPLIASTPNRNKTKDQSLRDQKKIPSNNQKSAQNSNSRAYGLRSATKRLSLQQFKPLVTNIMVASDEEPEEDNRGLVEFDNRGLVEFDNRSEESDDISVESNRSEELDDSHPLMRYENKNLWTDNDYQKVCLKKTIEMLKNDRSGRFADGLKQRAMETLSLPVLPIGPNIVPTIIFNSKGEPNFEFHFLSPNSPLDVRESLQTDDNIIFMSQIIYQTISLQSNSNNGQKKLIHNKRQIEFNN